MTHHSNYGKILALRQTSDALDEQIKSTLRLLADTRKELLSIPTCASTEDQDDDVEDSRRQVKVKDLLSYAKFISKTTVPPTFRTAVPEVVSQLPSSGDGSNGPATPAATGTTTTTTITGAGIDPGTSTIKQEPGTTTAAAATTPIIDTNPEDQTKATSNLPPSTIALLSNNDNVPFVPWPSQEVIANGALGHIQQMLEQGRDPDHVLSAEEQEADDKRRRDEEEKARAEEEERLRLRRESMLVVGGGGAGGGAHRQVHEDVFDPDEL